MDKHGAAIRFFLIIALLPICGCSGSLGIKAAEGRSPTDSSREHPLARSGLAIQTANDIRAEAALPNNGPTGHPLPLAASWNTGNLKNGYDPDYQMAMIEKGHHLLPWFQLDKAQNGGDANKVVGYYRKSLIRCSELHLPISFLSTQWEYPLSRKPYLGLPPKQNPNVVKADGSVEPKVSPFGPIGPWSQVGKEWTATEVVSRLESWYPDPPKVIFISNNEHPRLMWRDAKNELRYLARHGADMSELTRRQAVGEGWIERYRALQNGMRDGLTNTAWKRNSIFVGYEAFGSRFFGAWGGWIDQFLYIPNRIEAWPLAWDGGSVSYYVNDWQSSTDYNMTGPQIAAMNWVFMLDEAYRLNPDFWFEVSIWDGYVPDRPSNKRAFYAKQGQTYNPERYAGMVKFGMWLLRPRVVREFRASTQTRADTESYFLAIVKAVDDVYKNSALTEFWRQGRLIPNPAHPHPYQANIPPEYSSKARWFLLDTNVDPKRPWDLKTEIPVFSLCLEKGTAPQREWLVYVHSPLRNFDKVKLTIPGYGDIEVASNPSGNYYVLNEKDKKIKLLAAD